MSNVINSTTDFDFNGLTLGNTQSMQGGGYFTRLLFNDESFIIQTPKCYTKKGICKTGKKIYCDLKYSIIEKSDSDFIEWLEKIEEQTQDLIFENRNEWFLEAPTREDLEYMWNSCIRSFKSDYRLVRTFVQKPRQLHKGPTITVYDETENIKSIDDITKDGRMITIIELLGVKWTSQSEQLEVCLRQAMLLEDKPLFTQCLINNNFKNTITTQSLIEDDTEEKNETVSNDTNEAELVLEEENQENEQDTQDKEKIETQDPSDDIPESSNLFLDIKEKSKEIEDSENTIDLSDNNLETQEENLEDKNDIDLSQNIVENKDVSGNLTTPDNLEKEVTDISQNDITIDLEPLEKKEELHEVEINFADTKDSISLKNPNEVYIEIYKEAKKRAKQAKKLAIQAYLEAKRIKSVYLLDEFDSESDSDSDSQFEDENLISEEQ